MFYCLRKTKSSSGKYVNKRFTGRPAGNVRMTQASQGRRDGEINHTLTLAALS